MRTAYAEAQTLSLTASKNNDTADKATDKTVTVADVVFKGTKQDDNFSGLATELPFPAAVTEPAAGEHDMVFTYGTDGELTKVEIK